MVIEEKFGFRRDVGWADQMLTQNSPIKVSGARKRPHCRITDTGKLVGLRKGRCGMSVLSYLGSIN